MKKQYWSDIAKLTFAFVVSCTTTGLIIVTSKNETDPILPAFITIILFMAIIFRAAFYPFYEE